MLTKEQYLNDVCREIEFRAARKYLCKELSAHIDDKAEELRKEGAPNPEEAAVAAMGGAEETGRALNKAHRPRIEWGVIACVLLLSIAGSIIISLCSSEDIAFVSGAWSSAGQLKWLIISLCIMASMYFFDYTYISKLRFIIICLPFVLLGQYIFYGNFTEGPISQSGTVLLSTLFFQLGILGFIEAGRRKGLFGLLLPLFICVIAMFAMNLIWASLYSLMIALVTLAALGIALFHIPGKRYIRWISFISAAFILAVILFVIIKVPIVIGSSWAFGTGFGSDMNSYAIQKVLSDAQIAGPSMYYRGVSNIPGSATDFIFTSIIARFGWLAAVLIMLVFAALFIFMFIRIRKIAHTFGKMLATGITLYFLYKFVICILSNVVLIDGIQNGLPFISYGYYDYIADALLIGVFLSVWRRSSFMKNSVTLPIRLQGAEKT